MTAVPAPGYYSRQRGHGAAGRPGLGDEDVNARKWQCMTCGFVYDEALGVPDEGIDPGTAWEDVPEDWLCPECGTPKSDFEMIEVG